MPVIGDTYRIFYTAKGYKTGLADVRLVVFKPDLGKQGVYQLAEVNQGDGAGIYTCEYTHSDTPGTYLFVVNSASHPGKDARQVYFESPMSSGLDWSKVERSQIREALGITGERAQPEGGTLQNIAAQADFIAGIEGGRWQITNNQMLFYADDNTTEIARFDLFDSNDNPASENIFERKRV